MAYYILKSYKLKIDPFQIFESLHNQKNCFFLDSSLKDGRLGRYSFLGIDPFFVLSTKDKQPFQKIRQLLASYNLYLPKCHIPFLAGAVGYFSYDLGLSLEKKIKRKVKSDFEIPDCYFGFYNTTIIIDHLRQLLYIFAVGFPERDYRLAKLLAKANFKRICELILRVESIQSFKKNITPVAKNPLKLNSNFTPLEKLIKSTPNLLTGFTKTEYLLAIEKAKQYIKAGDIYQVNLSQHFHTKSELSSFEIYKRLRKISPSNFSAYLDTGDFQILSSSPERFLGLVGNVVTTRPMKGTRPRSKNKQQDRYLKKELLNSNKDKAELVMIVDLERNDLGKVCSYNSIKVTALRELEVYNTVFQTTATIEGRLHKDKDRISLLRACFPGGSITGCPKIRAMEIIEELEPARRGIYTGSLGYLSFSGNLDFNILIRTILKKDRCLYFGVGAGVVADSDPQKEYAETLVKARGMIEAIS